MFPAHFAWPMAPLVGLIALAGCGREATTNPVHGTVTLDGRPLAKATVQFLAQDPGGRDALGMGVHGGVGDDGVPDGRGGVMITDFISLPKRVTEVLITDCVVSHHPSM